MKEKFRRLLVFCLTLSGFQAAATHIVGGEMTYTCRGNSNYEIRLDIYQDCLDGDPTAISQDVPGYFTIFTGSGQILLIDSIPYAYPPFRVPTNFSNSCITNPPNTCLRKATFQRTYQLPPNPAGYYVVYQRCCRNASVINLNNPGAVGATYFCRIPPSNVSCNNSAIFTNYPPQIICINNPLVYDHSATDIDRDSLSYEFCTAYDGGSANDAKPVPMNINFRAVNYSPGYMATVPMRGNPNLKIDPTTGMITGTPNQAGRYVVTVCCNEWREGVLINTVKREFQFVVTNCSKAVVANIPQYSDEFNTYIVNCKNRTVTFDNLSTGGFAYSWDFGVANRNDDTSNLFTPTFTYPDTGTYIVKLVVNRGSTCPDSISRFVKVFPDFKGDFAISGLPCPNGQIFFTDQTTATYGPVSSWYWDFGDGRTSMDQNPIHNYDTGGKFNVVMVSKSIKGCTDTIRKEFDVERFRPYAGVQNDTMIVKGESIYFRATGGAFYTWTPGNYLSSTVISNPVGYYPDTTSIRYVVHIKSEVGCEGNDTVNVRVVNQSTLFVPSGFTPNGDGINDVLRPVGIGYRKINFFRVYNRWGQQVFYTVNFGEGWDGRIGGKEADLGTYFWQLSTVDRFGSDEKLQGDAVLIR
jgi:gliding motility-associated-like protein